MFWEKGIWRRKREWEKRNTHLQDQLLGSSMDQSPVEGKIKTCTHFMLSLKYPMASVGPSPRRELWSLRSGVSTVSGVSMIDSSARLAYKLQRCWGGRARHDLPTCHTPQATQNVLRCQPFHFWHGPCAQDMLSMQSDGRKEGTFGVMAFVFPSHCYTWRNPALPGTPACPWKCQWIFYFAFWRYGFCFPY